MPLRQRHPSWQNGRRALAVLILLALCPALAQPLLSDAMPEQAPPRFDQSRGSLVLAIGEDLASVDAVIEVADVLERLIVRDFGHWTDLYTPVMLELVPSAATHRPQPAFDVTEQSHGAMLVRLLWNEHTRIEDLCQALASGSLRWIARQRGLSERPPDWVELAYGTRLRTRLHPTTLDALTRLSREEAPMPLEAILGMKGPYGQDIDFVSRQSYWLARHLLEADSWPAQVADKPWAALIAGQLPPALRRALAEPRQLASRERHWAVSYINTVRGRQAPFRSPEETHELLKQFSSVVAEMDGRDQRLLGTELWLHRANPRVRAAVQQQLTRLKLELQATNPIYYNATLSLGQCYEALLNENAQAFFALFDQFLIDTRQAHTTRIEINHLLHW